MKYAKGSIGRVFVVRFEHGDDLVEKIKELAACENVRLATVILLGALRKGTMVTGPRELKTPAEANWSSFDDGREVFASGMIVNSGGEIKLHIHGSFGRGDAALTGCLRKDSEVFITVDAVVTEILGVKASKRRDEKTGHEVMFFEE